MAFRLMELPPEVRTRIFEFAAIDGAMLSPAPSQYPIEPGRDTMEWQRVRRDLYRDHYDSRHLAPRSNLALLLVSRQIAIEANAIFWSNVILDLRYVHLPEVLPSLKRLTLRLADKFQFVEHLEIDGLVENILFDPGWQSNPAHHRNWWSKELQSIYRPSRQDTRTLSGEIVDNLRLISSGLKNLKTLKVSPTVVIKHNEESTLFLGAQIMRLLVIREARDFIEGIYPKLVDIRTINGFGGERFVKTETGWELPYSGEKLPLDQWPILNAPHTPLAREIRVRQFDLATELLCDTSILFLGPTGSPGEECPYLAINS